jgi:Partial alpha/beta-hydrolase lipase region
MSAIYSPSPQSQKEQYSQQSQKLSHLGHDDPGAGTDNAAVEAKFITPIDSVIETTNGERLPAVPLDEARKLNTLKTGAEDEEENGKSDIGRDRSPAKKAQDLLHKVNQSSGTEGHKFNGSQQANGSGSKSTDRLSELQSPQSGADSSPTSKVWDAATDGPHPRSSNENSQRSAQSSGIELDSIKTKTEDSKIHQADAPLLHSAPPSETNPLFPPLPLYGPPTLLRSLQCYGFRLSSFVLSAAFLGVIVLGSAFTAVPMMFSHIGCRLRGVDPDSRRPFYELEKERKKTRAQLNKDWAENHKKKVHKKDVTVEDLEADARTHGGFVPTEGGADPLICDVGYYARRVGLDMEVFKVETEDGFIIQLWHIFDPKEYKRAPENARKSQGHAINLEKIMEEQKEGDWGYPTEGRKRYPVLMIHGLLQSAGAYCTNDDDSLAFYLCKRYVGHSICLLPLRCSCSLRLHPITQSNNVQAATMSGSETTVAASNPNTLCSNTAIRACGHGIFDKWAFLIFQH